MGIDDSTYELIDQYLQGKLPEDHSFVQLLKEDELLAQEVELRKLANVAILNYRLIDVEKLLESKRNDFVKQSSSEWKWLLGGLSIFIVATSVYFYVLKSEQKSIFTNPNILGEKNDLLQSDFKEEKNITIPKSKITKLGRTVEKEEIIEKKEIKDDNVLEVGQPSQIIVSENQPKTTQVELAPKEEFVHSKNEITSTVNPCNSIHFKAFVEEIRPCKGTTEGQLVIKDSRGGKAPYHYSLDNKYFQESNIFDGLKAGEYDLILKDANGCVEMVYEKYSLKSRNCSKHSEHIFNPNVNSWEVPNNPEKQGELSILDENGNLVYHRTLEKFEKINWNGSRNGGELLMPGVYIYNIKYSDGVVDQGNIAITY